MPTNYKNFLSATFRASPRYTLVSKSDVTPLHRNMLGGLWDDKNLFGILQPKNASNVGVKAVSIDTANLYTVVHQPALLPEEIRFSTDEVVKKGILRLILDGVLEIYLNDRFVCEEEACAIICKDSPLLEPTSQLSRLSHEALLYAQELRIEDALTLGARLYFFNRKPTSAYWRRCFSSPTAVASHLGIQTGDYTNKQLNRHWRKVKPSAALQGWYIWTQQHRRLDESEHLPVYKLYISPETEVMRDVFSIVIDVLGADSAHTIKVGSDVYGLLRPDKMIAYFSSFDVLLKITKQLAHELDGFPAHGVPFTAQLDNQGLLSWGVDPPKLERTPGLESAESWRVWIVNRLASAILIARGKATEGLGFPPWRFALERLRLEEVDVDNWTPLTSIWQRDE